MFTFSFWEVKAVFHFLGVINSVFRRANSLQGMHELMKSVHFVPILSFMKSRAGTILEVTKPPASTHPFQITVYCMEGLQSSGQIVRVTIITMLPLYIFTIAQETSNQMEYNERQHFRAVFYVTWSVFTPVVTF